MAAVFDLNWTPSGTSISQNVGYRQRGNVDWIYNANITAPNPQTSIANSATVGALAYNTTYQFQVVSICGGVSNGSRIYEMIQYHCQTPTYVIIGESPTATLSVSQSPIITVELIEYQLLSSMAVVLETQNATGISPNANFATALSSGTYTIQWRYGTTINGVTLYSDDTSQLNAWCVTDTITIP